MAEPEQLQSAKDTHNGEQSDKCGVCYHADHLRTHMRNHKVEQSVAEPGAIPAAGESKKLGKRVNGASQRANSLPSLSIYYFLLFSLVFFSTQNREKILHGKALGQWLGKLPTA